MSTAGSTSSVFHKLVVLLSGTTPPLSLDKLSEKIGSSPLVEQVLTNNPEIFYKEEGCYRITTTSCALILSTYLSLSSNVTAGPSKNDASESHFHSFMVKSSSSHFSSIKVIPRQTSPPNGSSIEFILPNAVTYSVPCPLLDNTLSAWPAIMASESQLLASVKFAINNRQQLMCLVMTLSKDGKMLTYAPTPHNHVPLWWPWKSKDKRSEVIVKSDIVNKDKQFNWFDKQQNVLVLKAWVLLINYSKEVAAVKMCSINVMTEYLSNVGKMTPTEEKVSELLSRYRAIFSVSDHQISLHPTNPLYWSQLLLLCSNITPADGLAHVPLSPVQLGITLTKKESVVLRR